MLSPATSRTPARNSKPLPDSVKELLPVSVFKAAHAGDSIAMDKVLGHYEPYISKLCTRKLYDEYGGAHHCLDEYMKRHLEIKLITAILNSMEFE